MTEIAGLKVIIRPSWVKAWRNCGPPARVPSKGQGRKGTKRWWKKHRGRAHGWRHVTVEPDHMIRGHDFLICTPAQHAALMESFRRQAA